MSYKLVEIEAIVRDEVGELVLGIYRPLTKTINLHLGSIAEVASRDGDDYDDLKEMVLLHEQGHFLQHSHGIKFPYRYKRLKNKKRASEFIESNADAYAWRMFVRQHGRAPRIDKGGWFQWD